MALNFARLTKTFAALALVLCFVSSNALADQTTEMHTSGGPRRQLATILFAGLGGAVLGLSTLSFYGRPQDKLANIAIGFAGGVIIGTTFVTYRAATNPQEFYGQTKPFIEEERERNSKPVAAPAMYSLNFDF